MNIQVFPLFKILKIKIVGKQNNSENYFSNIKLYKPDIKDYKTI